MLGIEFTENDIGITFAKGMFDRKVLTGGTLINARVVRIEPPLTITEKLVNDALRITEEVIASHEMQQAVQAARK